MNDGNVICNGCGHIFWDDDGVITDNGTLSCPVCGSDDLEDYPEDEEEESDD